MSHLNQRLMETKNRVDRLTRLEQRIQSLESEQAELERQVKNLQARLARKQQDVARLERLSLTNLFFTLTGKKESRVQAEQQELLSAALRLREAEQRLKDVTADLAPLRQEANALRGAREEYQRLLAEKEAAITAAGGAAAERLFQLDEQERQIQWQIQQIREALQAAMHADAALAKVEGCLDSARALGTWDLLGGGLIATAMKHSEMDDAERAAADAQHALNRLSRELQDVAGTTPVVGDVSVGGFLRFADYFFDGLITDWMVQSRINNSMASARRARQQVTSVMSALKQRLAQAESALEQVREERKRFLTTGQ